MSLAQRAVERNDAGSDLNDGACDGVGNASQAQVPIARPLPRSGTDAYLAAIMRDPAEVESTPALLARDAPETSPLPRPAGLFVNVHARRGEEGFHEAKETLDALGLSCVCTESFHEPDRLFAALEEALRGGMKLAIVGGGDGTIRGVAQLIARYGATLGVLPLGTGNDFARALGIPFDIPSAIEIITHGTTTEVDVGLANGKAFLNACSVGMTTELARVLDGRLKRWLGPLAYPIGGLKAGLGMRPFRAALEVDGERWLEGPVWQVVVGNSRYQGGGHVTAPTAAPDDRRLHCYAILAREATGLRRVRELGRLARIGVKTRKGQHLGHPAVVSVRGKAFRLLTEPERSFNVDGELCGHSPLTIQLAEHALKVRAPALRKLRRWRRTVH
jgi:YegS/Rv2252/BmrU family lipid kinase